MSFCFYRCIIDVIIITLFHYIIIIITLFHYIIITLRCHYNYIALIVASSFHNFLFSWCHYYTAVTTNINRACEAEVGRAVLIIFFYIFFIFISYFLFCTIAPARRRSAGQSMLRQAWEREREGGREEGNERERERGREGGREGEAE